MGYDDVQQNVEVYVEKSPANGEALVAALTELEFELSDDDETWIRQGKDFVQLKNGPFDLNLIFAPDGIERFEDARRRRVEVEGFMVCHPDDIIGSKAAANRRKNRESLERLRAFREYLEGEATPLMSR